MDVPVIQIKHRLRIARESAGFDRNAQAFADALGLSRQTVNSYERGHSVPDRRTIMAWALQTDVPVWWLSGADGPEEGLPRLVSIQQPAGYRIIPAIASLDDKRRVVSAITYAAAS